MTQQQGHGAHEHHHHDDEKRVVISREQLFAALTEAYEEADAIASKELSRAGVLLIVDQPFFGAVFSMLRKVPTMAVPTLSTDGLHIFYNPFFVNTLERRDLPGVLGHECMHVVLDHAARCGKRDRDRWNIAGDYVINLILKEAGLSLPKEGLYDPKYKGLTSEQVYDKLPVQESASSGGGKSGGGGDKDGCQHCNGILDPAPPEEVPPHMKPEQIAVQAAMAAKLQGKLPASLESLIQDIVNPKIAWQKILRNFVSVNNKDNYTWLKPNRRYLQHGHYLPSLHGQQVGECVVVFDTSGSVSDKEATAFLSEMTSILRDVKPKKIHFIQCDAMVHSHDELTVQDLPLKVTIKGRGGTAFTPPFKHVAKAGINPKFLVYMTDGYANDFPAAPNYPVMWVTTGSDKFPWGEILKLSLDE